MLCSYEVDEFEVMRRNATRVEVGEERRRGREVVRWRCRTTRGTTRVMYMMEQLINVMKGVLYVMDLMEGVMILMMVVMDVGCL